MREVPIHGIEDVPTQRAFKALRAELLALMERLDALEGATAGTGEANTASNLGAGSGLYASKSGVDLRFKSLVAGSNVTLTPAADTVTIAASSSGEANTASNVGAGSQVFKAKTGVDLAFRSIVGGANVTVTQNTNDITLTAAAPGETNTASNLGSGSGLFASKVGVDLRFKSLVGGDNVTLTAGANDITIAVPFTGFGSQFLGNGSDGALVFNGVATVLGIVPATAPATSPYSGSKTYSLTRDIFATSISISAGVVIVGNSHRIWCTGDIAGPGKIARSGFPGASATTSAGGAGGANAGSADTLGSSGAGGNGGAGGNPNALGNVGGGSTQAPFGLTAGSTATTPIGGNTGATGGVGQGGSGGSTTNSGTGGTSGACTITNTTAGGYVATMPQCLTGRTLSNLPFSGGSGGGGGGGGFATSGPTTGAGGGGGGGGGAGPLVVAARSFSGGVTIEARGGDGGNGANATGAGVANGGAGGAGGGGSWATVCYAEGTAPTVTVTGGTGGTGGTSVGGALQAGNGGNGGAGLAYIFNLGA